MGLFDSAMIDPPSLSYNCAPKNLFDAVAIRNMMDSPISLSYNSAPYGSRWCCCYLKYDGSSYPAYPIILHNSAHMELFNAVAIWNMIDPPLSLSYNCANMDLFDVVAIWNMMDSIPAYPMIVSIWISLMLSLSEIWWIPPLSLSYNCA